MAIRIVRLGSPREKGRACASEPCGGPAGVPKHEFASRDFYDVWLPNLAPSEALLKRALQAEDARAWRSFVRSFRSEMKRPEASRVLDLLAALSHGATSRWAATAWTRRAATARSCGSCSSNGQQTWPEPVARAGICFRCERGAVSPDGYPRSAARRLLGPIFAPGPSAAAYILRSWPLAMVPAVLLVAAVALIARLAGHPMPVMPRPKIGFFFLVVLGPILETLMMVPVLWLLRRMFSSRLTAAILSAVLWAVLHAMQSPAQGVSALWGFFVLSSAFLGWRQRSLLAAFWVTCALHALNNLTVWTLLASVHAGGNRAGLVATALILGLMAGGVALAPSLEARSRPTESPEVGTGGVTRGAARSTLSRSTWLARAGCFDRRYGDRGLAQHAMVKGSRRAPCLSPRARARTAGGRRPGADRRGPAPEGSWRPR
jgi:uncharacterized protein YeaO (DUF488 family)